MSIEMQLDREGPVPLYHQIVQAIRWRIGTGVLRRDDALPPVREAAERWQVNYHTVRRAYRELVADGWVEVQHGAGTRVAAIAPSRLNRGEGSLEEWLSTVVEMASRNYALSAGELAELIAMRSSSVRLVMVECNAHQSEYLAEQLERELGVEAVAWPLDAPQPPRELPIIGTYFHHSEMRNRWPDRIDDMHFVTLYLDPALRERVEKAAARSGAAVLRLVERDPATAREMAAGVAALLSDSFRIEPTAGDPNDLLLQLRDGELLLVAPRLWDQVSTACRTDERVLDVRHVIVPEDIQRLRRTVARQHRALPAR
jgi:DNA-binding transcriptional regulator YhcF (GntR family)